MAQVEAWATLREYPSYKFSDKGRVFSFLSNEYLKGGAGGFKGNYIKLGLKNKNNILKYVYLHRAVATAFVKGKDKEKNQINHKDGDPKNNCAKNLEWVTAKENSVHRSATLGRSNSKLKEEDVWMIRELYGTFTFEEIGLMYGMPRGSIHRIVRRKTWLHI